MAWIKIDELTPAGVNPKLAGLLILKGTIDRSTLSDDEDAVFPTSIMRVFGYWDTIDEAWALSSTPWYGPFFIPTHFAEIPKELSL